MPRPASDPTIDVDYPTSCPLCGRALLIVANADVQTAPWGCPPCGRGWWPAELRGAQTHSHLLDPIIGWRSHVDTHAILAAADRERQQAIGHGVSLRLEQVARLDPDTLRFWLPRARSALASQIAAQLVFWNEPLHGQSDPKRASEGEQP